MDTGNRYLGNTGYIIPGEDYYLLGILSPRGRLGFSSARPRSPYVCAGIVGNTG